MKNTKQKSYQAFTLVELSVVIVIISIMLASVIVSKSLIDSAKVNKVYEEYRSYHNGIYQFYDQHGCLPGDCSIEQIPDIASKISSVCTTPNLFLNLQ